MLWQNLAEKIGLKPEVIEGDWREVADPQSNRCSKPPCLTDGGHDLRLGVA